MSTRKELVRDKIEAVARLWYASEPDKGLRERLTEGLIDKMTAAVLPALAEASQRSETAAALAALAEYDRTGIPQPSVAEQAGSETGTQCCVPLGCYTRAGDRACPIDCPCKVCHSAAGSETPAPAK